MPRQPQIRNKIATRTAFVGHTVLCYNSKDGCDGISVVYCLPGDAPPPKLCYDCQRSGAPHERGLGGLGAEIRHEEIRYQPRSQQIDMGATIYTPDHPDFPAIASQCTPILEIPERIMPIYNVQA